MASTRKKRGEVDLELWQQWDQSGRKTEKLQPLFDSFRGMISSHVNRYSGVEIPKPILEGAFKQEFVAALHSYRPEKAALGTWVSRNLQKGQRWVIQNQNTVRIPESLSPKMIGVYNDARASLSFSLAREPTDDEISEHTGMSPKTVKRLRLQQHRDLVGSDMVEDPLGNTPSYTTEMLKLLPYDLTSQEKLVWDYTLGLNGREKLSGRETAKRLGVSDSTVSNLKRKIGDKAKVYLNQ